MSLPESFSVLLLKLLDHRLIPNLIFHSGQMVLFKTISQHYSDSRQEFPWSPDCQEDRSGWCPLAHVPGCLVWFSGLPLHPHPLLLTPLVLRSAELDSASSLQVKLVCNIFRTQQCTFQLQTSNPNQLLKYLSFRVQNLFFKQGGKLGRKESTEKKKKDKIQTKSDIGHLTLANTTPRPRPS